MSVTTRDWSQRHVCKQQANNNKLPRAIRSNRDDMCSSKSQTICVMQLTPDNNIGMGMATPYAAAVPPPAAGTGGNAAATSYTNLWQFVDKVALKVGMTQANLVEDFDMRREPGAFHGVRQHTAALFENELDRYSWVLGGRTAGKLYTILPTGPASGTMVQKRAGPFQ